MVVMNEKSVRRYLDDLLVKMEVFEEDSEIRKKLSYELIETVNFYKNHYPSILNEYQEKGNKILEKYENE